MVYHCLAASLRMSLSTVNPSELAPEQRRALQEFEDRLSSTDEHSQPLPNSLIPSNFFAFQNEPFGDLPHGDTWIWNQTTRKVKVPLSDGQVVILQKLNARKRRGCDKAPSYKLWSFHRESGSTESTPLYALWCEKGHEDEDSQPCSPVRRPPATLPGTGSEHPIDLILQKRRLDEDMFQPEAKQARLLPPAVVGKRTG